MKHKIFSLSLLTVILVTLTVLSVSATDYSVSTNTLSLSKSVNQTSFTITNLNSTDSIIVNIPKFPDITDGDGHTLLISQSKTGNFEIAAGSNQQVTVSYSLPVDTDLGDLALGLFSSSIIVSDGTDNSTINLNFRSGYCEDGNLIDPTDHRYLEITSVKDRSSSKDWEWHPLDKVEIEVKVKFRSDDNDDSIDALINLGLYDTENQEFISLDNDDYAEESVSLDEGNSETVTFLITVPVEDLVDSSTRYKLYVKAYEDGEEDNLCTDKINNDYYQDINLKKDSYSVVLDELEVTTPTPCGQEVQVNLRAYNIGSHDEDKVQVTIYNTEFGVELKSETFSLDQGDARRISFNFEVPKDAAEKTYTLSLYSSYRYSDSSETYREGSDVYSLPLKVEGECSTTTGENKNARITAELDPETPEAIAGKQVIIRANLQNTGDSTTTYTLAVVGNSVWSSLVSIDPQVLTLDAGQSRDVNVVLSLDSDITGEKEFTIRALYDGQTTEQQVSLFISPQTVTGSNIVANLEANWFIYVIIIINIILIIAIIAVVRRMLSPRVPAM